MVLLPVKYTVLGISAALFAFMLLSQVKRIRQLEGIDFEAAARDNMEKSVASFNLLFSETDTLFNAIYPLLQQKASPRTIETVLRTKGNTFFTDGFYMIPADSENITFISCDGEKFKADRTHRPAQQWFHQAITGEQEFGGPVFDTSQGERILYCRKKLPADAGESRIIFIYSARKLYQRLLEMGLNRYGLPYIMDISTHFVAHPLDETRSLLELGYAFNDKVLVEMSKDVINHRPADKKYRHINTVTRKLCDEILYPISHTGWLLGLSVYDGIPLETGEYQKALRQGHIQAMILFTLLLLLLCAFLSCRKIKPTVYGSFLLYPLLFLIMMVGIVTVYNRYPQQSLQKVDTKNDFCCEGDNRQVENAGYRFYKWDPKRIIDRSSLNVFIDDYQKESIMLYDQPAKIIPTGIYIYSLAFLDSHTIKITGTAWQKYLISGKPYPKEMQQKYHNDKYENAGIFFPGGHVSSMERLDSIEITLDNQSAILFRWNFDVEIEQQLSYSLYPFGKNEIALTLWSNDLDDNTILAPDLESYKQIYPTDMPGLDNHFHIKGWDVSGSYYSYSMESYLCNFGNPDIYGINKFPELIFNISISRKFIDILICKIVPLMVVLVLLFTILFVRVKSDGFNNIIGCSGLFFVLVLDHINLRENVLSEQIMYLEYCYFFSYILLLLITITSFDISKNGHSYNAWVDTVLKKYFWTVIFGAMAVVTVVFFR